MMKRLTARNKDGGAYFPHCFREDTCDGNGYSEKCNDCGFAQQICEKLAAYEDTGITAEQMREIDRLYAEKCRELAEVKENLNLLQTKTLN